MENQDTPNIRRTSRITAGVPPNHHGDFVCLDKMGRKSQPSLTTQEIFDVGDNNESTSRSASDHASSKPAEFIRKSSSVRSHRTFTSTTSSCNTIRRMNLEAKLKVQKEINALADEEDELATSLARLEMKKKLQKLQREKNLVQQSFELEKSRLQEVAENIFETSSLRLSEKGLAEDYQEERIPIHE
ncbi:unnamed protein product [Allacma fusca]|uniref:Uncharacterized protein n=1 Tax=Allacma fusca TaxID=39272 RepID=A0A8J2L057_9HEXA|nr:unnamed protein product [Allacma fusca]